MTTSNINGDSYEIADGKADTGDQPPVQVSQRVNAAEWNASAEAIIALAEITNGLFIPTGTTQVEVQAAIDKAQAAHGVVRLKPGVTYTIAAGLTMNADQVVLDARGATLRATVSDIAMLTLLNNGSRAPYHQSIIGGLWDGGGVQGKTNVQAIVAIAGENLLIDGPFFYACSGTGSVGLHLNGDPSLDTYGGGGFRFLAVTVRNAKSLYCQKAYWQNRQSNPNFTDAHFIQCSGDINVNAFVIDGGNYARLTGCNAQASTNHGLSVDGTIVNAVQCYFDNGDLDGETYLANNAQVIGSGSNFGEVTFADALSSIVGNDNYLSALPLNRIQAGRANRLGDNNVWGSPNWPAHENKSPTFGGHVAIIGQIWTDVMGTRWVCTRGGTNNTVGGAKWAPLDGRIVMPFKYTMLNNGALFFWFEEDFLVTKFRLVITEQFLHGSATPDLQFGSGPDGDEWLTMTQLAYSGLTAGAVFDAADNAGGHGHLAGGKSKLMTGVGGRSADAGTSSVIQYASPTDAGWTQGKGFIIVEGVPLYNQSNIQYV